MSTALARIAYETYTKVAGGLDRPWDELPTAAKEAWDTVAGAVVDAWCEDVHA